MKRKNKKGRERRLFPRVDQKVPVKIAADGYGFETSTQNVSCVGTYCHINKYIPPFTKVNIKLSLPMAKDSRSVECKGVIVRTEDAGTGGFNIAVFFNQIKEEQRKKISQYISQFLPQGPL